MPVPKVEKSTPSNDPAHNKQLSLAGKWPNYEFKSLPVCDLSSCTKREIKEYFKNTYDLDELLFSSIQNEKYLYCCPDRLRLPLIFYLPHPSSVYINKLMLAGLIEERVNFHFEKLFETGVDEMSWDDTENYRMGGEFEWPGVSEVIEYRNKVRQVVNDVIDKAPLELPVKQDSPWWSVFMGMEHERIHIETSSVLIRQLPVEALKRPENWIYAPPMADMAPGPNTLVKVPAGKVVIGKPWDFPSYGWDNEYGHCITNVPEFETSQYLVSNEEYLEFMQDGGYSRPELWTEEGWKWREFREAVHPVFWVCGEGCKSGCGAQLASYSHCDVSVANGDSNGHSQESNGAANGKPIKYKYRAMFDVIDMPWCWPAEVNYHEAKAYCSWKGPQFRLPTEAEYHRMRGKEEPSCDVSCDPSSFNDKYPANSNLKYGSSTAVNMYPPNSMGLYDVFGNVWQWTEDHFNGLPGFKTTYLYDDFSTPCFDGRHNIIMGGSWVSTGLEASRFARFAFRRHFIQHAGFRLVRSSADAPMRVCKVEVFVLGAGVADNPVTAPGVDLDKTAVESTNDQFQFETEEKLQEQLKLEYDSNDTSLVDFVDKVLLEQGCGRDAGIQFGCGTGRNSLLLGKLFDSLTAVDYCGRFLDAALKIQGGMCVQYGEGQTAVIPAGARPERVHFIQLTWVSNEVEGYNAVIFEFIDRLSEPRGWLLKLWEVVIGEGVVIFLIAPDSKWDEKKIGDVIGKRFDLKMKTTLGSKNIIVWKRKL